MSASISFWREYLRREALEAAISEKDAHLALLEMSGIRSAKQADEVDRLRVDRRRLVDRLRQEVNYFYFLDKFKTLSFITERVERVPNGRTRR